MSYLRWFVPESICYQYTSVGPFFWHNFVSIDIGNCNKASWAKANEDLRDSHETYNIVSCTYIEQNHGKYLDWNTKNNAELSAVVIANKIDKYHSHHWAQPIQRLNQIPVIFSVTVQFILSCYCIVVYYISRLLLIVHLSNFKQASSSEVETPSQSKTGFMK